MSQILRVETSPGILCTNILNVYNNAHYTEYFNLISPVWLSDYLLRKGVPYLLPQFKLTHSVCIYLSNTGKMVSSVFETFWPVLKFFQIMGMFPIKKSSENRCGFQTISTKRYLILTIGVQMLGFVSAILAMSYIMVKHDIHFLHLWKELFAVTASTLDAIIIFSILFLLSLSSYGLIVGLLTLKNNIISLLEVFVSIDILKYPQPLEIKLKLSLLLLAWMILPAFLSFG